MKKILYLFFIILVVSCGSVKSSKEKEVSVIEYQDTFLWENANFYFLLIDRFQNGETTNDISFSRTAKTGKLRGFEGGDLRGIIKKIDENYFTDLGITAIWMTPIVEQIHDGTDEGTGKTYGYHGYWTKDWTALDPNFGTEDDLRELVEKAHNKGIRVVLDAVVNHTGPVTEIDEAFPSDWVRTEPACTYENYETTIECTLVKNLPDILTENNEDVELPEFLIQKWKNEGRYEEEIASLNAFFEKTGYPRAPKYYIMKWLADYVSKFGIDGYRVDTVKHTTEDVWEDFAKITQDAFDTYNLQNPEKFMGSKKFFLVGEVYGYGISQKENYHFPDTVVNYFAHGFPALINFDFKSDANQSFEELFSSYSDILNGEMKGKMIMNYISSHDDGSPFDKDREMPYEAGTLLLLSPGISQIYYGDETARPLVIPGAEGDANLRSFMNWEDLEMDLETREILSHYQKLGQFRQHHVSVGAGIHEMISEEPYWFKRTYDQNGIHDVVVIGLDLPVGINTLDVSNVFEEGDQIRDAYSGLTTQVKRGKVSFDLDESIVLLEKVE